MFAKLWFMTATFFLLEWRGLLCGQKLVASDGFTTFKNGSKDYFLLTIDSESSGKKINLAALNKDTQTEDQEQTLSFGATLGCKKSQDLNLILCTRILFLLYYSQPHYYTSDTIEGRNNVYVPQEGVFAGGSWCASCLQSYSSLLLVVRMGEGGGVALSKSVYCCSSLYFLLATCYERII